MIRHILSIFLIAGAVTYSASGFAQQLRGTVNVDITEIKPLIAANLGVAVDDIPENVVQVPIPIATEVCGVTEEFFRDQDTAADELPICTAKATSDQLDEHIRDLIES